MSFDHCTRTHAVVATPTNNGPYYWNGVGWVADEEHAALMTPEVAAGVLKAIKYLPTLQIAGPGIMYARVELLDNGTRASRMARADIITHLLEWVERHEKKGQAVEPIAFGSVVRDDITLRDMLDIARGRKGR